MSLVLGKTDPYNAARINKHFTGVLNLLLRGDFWKRPATLKPYVLKVKDGFLLGLAMDPEKGAPCSNCVLLWMKQRNIWVQSSSLSELTIRRDLIPDLLAENSAHTIYEISKDGTAIKMESLVFPHPQCVCDRSNYLPPETTSKNTNYAFSPLYQIFCTRFGTPDGNLWLTRVTGDCPLSERPLTVYSVEKDKELSRKKAVDEWMKKATQIDLPRRVKRGELIASEVLQTGDLELMKSQFSDSSEMAAMGAGKDKEEATLNALVELAKITTLKRYSNTMKNPMLVVGANNWIRTKVPFFLLQKYDLHLLFYPNSTQAWVVGLVAFSRQRTDEKPVFVFAAHTDAKQALEELFFKILEALKPEEQLTGDPVLRNERGGPHASRLNMWWTHWIYRCPKIALKDVLHLEAYPRKLQNWRDYYRDGQDKVSVLFVNSPHLPSQIRTIVKVSSALRDDVSTVRNINGIGTWSDFSDALA